MLWEFGFKNFFSFKEGATFSFALDANCPQHISLGCDYTPVICVKGANASGKTNVLRALSFFENFAIDSFANKPDSKMHSLPHFNSTNPTEMFIDFEIDGLRYLYELVFTRESVKSEVIYRTKTKKTKIVERTGDKFSFLTKEFSQLDAIKLRNNVSIISMAHQYGLNELDDLYKFFDSIESNVSFGGIHYDLETEEEASEILSKDERALDFVKEFIRSVDVGVTDIEIFEMDAREKDGEKKVRYIPFFYHGDVGDFDFAITKHTESSGTRALFKRLGRYKKVLDSGGVMVADEFDIHLHPHILPKLLSLFTDKSFNKKRAQLIFTTHNSDILNLLGKYRTYLVNKDNNESFAYRLDEIGGDLLRNDRPIAPIYNEGKIGGIPKL